MRIEWNDKEFKRYIENLEKNIPKAVENAVRATAIEGEQTAKLAEKAVITNRLRSSIHWEDSKVRKHVYRDFDGLSFDGSFTYKAQELEALFGTNVEYAIRVNDNPNSKGFGFFQAGVQKAKRAFPVILEREIKRAYAKS